MQQTFARISSLYFLLVVHMREGGSTATKVSLWHGLTGTTFNDWYSIKIVWHTLLSEFSRHLSYVNFRKLQFPATTEPCKIPACGASMEQAKVERESEMVASSTQHIKSSGGEKRGHLQNPQTNIV